MPDRRFHPRRARKPTPNKRIEQTAKAFAVILLGIVQLLIRNTFDRPWRALTLLATLKDRATRALKADSYALYLVARDPRTPWYAKLLAAGVVAYAVSPIDLIPDFIPVLGYLDDLILLPLGIALAIKLVPDDVLSDCRAQAAKSANGGGRVSYVAGAVVVVIWILVAAAVFAWLYRRFVVRY